MDDITLFTEEHKERLVDSGYLTDVVECLIDSKIRLSIDEHGDGAYTVTLAARAPGLSVDDPFAELMCAACSGNGYELALFDPDDARALLGFSRRSIYDDHVPPSGIGSVSLWSERSNYDGLGVLCARCVVNAYESLTAWCRKIYAKVLTVTEKTYLLTISYEGAYTVEVRCDPDDIDAFADDAELNVMVDVELDVTDERLVPGSWSLDHEYTDVTYDTVEN